MIEFVASTGAARLRQKAEAAAAVLPALVLAAERLAASVAPGAHGLRRAGPGEDFWQYRPAGLGDDAGRIDWRRSARSDARFVRDRERQSPHRLDIWVGRGAGMEHAGNAAPAGAETKRHRALLLGLALASIAQRGGERVGWLGGSAGTGRAQIEALAHEALSRPAVSADGDAPDAALIRPGRTLVLVDDMLGDLSGIESALERATAIGTRGALLQVLHPEEVEFPFHGAVEFATAGGSLRHLTRDAEGLAAAYRARLQERQELLGRLAAAAGFGFTVHRLDHPPAEALHALVGLLA